MTLCTYAKGAQCICMDEKECPHRPDTLKTVQALVEPTVTLPRRIVQGALEAINYGDKAAWAMNLEGVKEELQRALIAQMQRDAVQPVAKDGWVLVPRWPTPAMHDAMLTWGTKRSEWNAILDAAPHPEAQALDSQLQQPAADSTRASGVCASTTPLPSPAHRGPTGTGAYFDSYTAEQMQERDRQVVEHVIRACYDVAASDDFYGSPVQVQIAAAILALLPVKEPKE